jgi:pyruvate,water dikinase
MEEFRDITLPSIIYGDQPPPANEQAGDKLKGIPTSRGYYTGPVRVIRGIREFKNLKTGDVLVIPFSDVGWTPLFTKAGAVIAESGGLLSHSSIIAREYNIPAVVSVPGACHLEDTTLVTVDGYRGEIVIHETA